MRVAVVGLVAAGMVLVGGGVGANHAGCLATSAVPQCTYTAIGAHSALGYSEGGWEATVVRTIGGVETTVVVGSGEGGPVAIEAVDARANETVTLTLLPGTGGVPVGAVSAGNTAGHI